jgi:hypothetical protein
MQSRIQCACVRVRMRNRACQDMQRSCASVVVGVRLSLLICLLEFTDMQRNLVLTLA